MTVMIKKGTNADMFVTPRVLNTVAFTIKQRFIKLQENTMEIQCITKLIFNDPGDSVLFK